METIQFIEYMKLTLEKGLRPFEKIQEDGNDEILFDVANRVLSTKLVYAVDGRNAWWNIWVKRYYPKSYSLNPEFAKDSVEKWRVQGSTWTIREVPAIAFVGAKTALIITEINAKNILTNYPFDKKITPYISSLASYFEPSATHDVVRLITENISLLESIKKFYSYKSHSRGSGYRLFWIEQERNDVCFNVFEGWRRRFKELLKDKCFWGVLYTQHRDGVEISRVLPGSPASVAGMREGDIVLSVEDLTKKKSLSMNDLFAFSRPGTQIAFHVLRDGKRMEFNMETVSFSMALPGVSRQKAKY